MSVKRKSTSISINDKLESIINIDKGESRKSVAKRLDVSVSTIAYNLQILKELQNTRNYLIKNNLTDDNCLLHITHIINTFNNHVDNNLIQSKMNNYFNKK